jgi:hypothetical protein
MHSDTHYLRRSAAHDKNYIAAFRAMTPEDRAAQRRAGITRPELNDHYSHQGTVDVSDFTEVAAPEENPRERLADILAEDFGVPPAFAAALVDFIGELVEHESANRRRVAVARVTATLLIESNVPVSLTGLAFAVELNALNSERFRSKTQAEAARHLGCCRQYVSEAANKWCDMLELPRPNGMKSSKARITYSTERRGDKHWRARKSTAAELALATDKDALARHRQQTRELAAKAA